MTATSMRPASRVDARAPLPKVLYVGGSGRSGTTLLDRMLGQVPGVWSTGELARVWDNGLRDNELCGCGEPFWECAFWREVGDAAFGGWHQVDVEHVTVAHHH